MQRTLRMKVIRKEGKDYIGYEYKTLICEIENFSFLLDCYENFGWNLDERSSERKGNKDIPIHLRR